MSPVVDRHIDPDADFAQHTVLLGAKDVAISQTDILQDAFLPGFPFEIVAVEHFATDQVNTITYMVKIGTTDALAGETGVTDLTRGDATLHATRANVLGSATDVINLHATSDGSGTFTGLKVRVTFKRQLDVILA